MAAGVLSAFGLTAANIETAKEKWQDIPNTVDVGKVSVSVRQFKTLESLAAKRKQSVSDLVNGTIAKAIDGLLKETE